MKTFINNVRLKIRFLIGFLFFFLLGIILMTQSCSDGPTEGISPDAKPQGPLSEIEIDAEEIEDEMMVDFEEEHKSRYGLFEFENDLSFFNFVGSRYTSLDDVDNIRILFQLRRMNGGKYGGEVTIGYLRRGLLKKETFKSHVDDVSKNEWKIVNDGYLWVGAFQGDDGAIIVVTDILRDDGEGLMDRVSGSVWFRRFTKEGKRGPPSQHKACWKISLGPYDCRFSLECRADFCRPRRNYFKLGTFSGLSLERAGLESSIPGRRMSSVEKKHFLIESLQKVFLYFKRLLKKLGISN